MRFTKMHGLGNDYVYINTFEQKVAQPDRLAKVMSDRHRGIGSDGLILIGSSNVADVRMTMFNADGSRAEMCGNGIRCVAKYAVEHGIVPGSELMVETDSGVKATVCVMEGSKVNAVRVDMGIPELSSSSIPTNADVEQLVDYPLVILNQNFGVTCVSMGNPHAVVFVDEFDGIDLNRLGSAFEHDALFPDRINTHFVRVDSREHVVIKTWERGSGATRACGTGACAVCVAGVVTGRTDRTVLTSLPGGDLSIEWSENDHVYMTGPAVEVFSGDWLSDELMS